MTQKDKTKEDFIEEINSLKKRIVELENADSERKQQQQQQQIDGELQKSEAKLRDILDATPFPVALVDVQDNKINFWSRSATTLFGHIASTATEWYQLAYPDPDYQRRVLVQWKLALEKAKLTGQPVNAGEYQVTCRDGSMRICELYATFLVDKLIVTFSDITERKTAEDALRESEIHYRELVQNVNSVIIRWRRDGTISFFNEYALKFFGYSLNEVIDKDVNILLPQNETTGRDLSNLVKNIIDHPDQHINNINENICKDGRRVWMAWTNKPVINDQGQVDEILCIGSDISEFKKLEDELKKSQERYHDLVEGTDDLIAIVDKQGKFIYVNHAAEKVVGLNPKDCIGLSAFDFIHPEDQERTKNEFDNWVLNKIAHASHQNRQVSKSGKITEMLWAINPHFDSSGKIVDIFSIARDITERNKLEVYKDINRDVLLVLNGPESLEPLVHRVLDALKTRTECDAVGIRLQEGDDFPYFIQQGFSDNFLLTENTLIERSQDGGVCRDKNGKVSLECTCGLVISGKTDPASSFFTPGGSFWTNDSFPLLELTAEQDPRLNPRNQCIHHGYASVALIPIRNKNKIVGLLQLNDRRKDQFSLIKIEILEEIATHLGEALIRKKLEEANNNHLHELEVFYKSSIGREERIIELKKEVEDLKKKLKK